MEYKAFISYSHADDGRLAPALQLALQRFAKPWNRLRNFRIFRDQSDLSATPQLWRNIQRALDQSEYFILMASEAAARSKWVAKEIGYWLERRSADTLLLLVTDGTFVWDEEGQDFDWDSCTAVPPALQGVFQQEPLHFDFRSFGAGETLSLKNTVFRAKILPIAATLHGIAPGDLVGEEVSRHRKAMRLARLALISLVFLALSTSLAAIWALNQRSLAELRRDEALRTQSLFLADLSRQKVRNGEGATAMRLALAALPQDPANPDRPWVVQAEAALYNALMSSWESAVLDAHKNGVRQAAFSHDDSLLVTVGIDGRALVWDTRSGQTLLTLAEEESEHVISAAFDPDGTHLVTGSRQGRVRVYDLKSGKLRMELVSVEEPRIGIAMTPLYPELVDELGMGELMGVMVDDVFAGSVAEHAGIMRGDLLTHLDGNPIDFFKTGRPPFADVSAGAAIEIRLVRDGDVRSISVIPTRHNIDKASRGQINIVRYSPDGRTILAADDLGRIYCWDGATGAQLGTLYDGRQPIDHVEFVGEAGRIFSAGYSDNRLDRPAARIWNTETLMPEMMLDYSAVATNDSRYKVDSARISQDGRRILTINNTSNGLWDAGTGRLIALTSGDGGGYGEFSPDSRYFATAYGWDAKLWEARDAEAKAVFFGHTEDVRHLAFSPDSQYLVTASADKTARIWDVRTGRTQAILRGHKDEVEYAAFSHDGRALVTLSDDHTARLWRFAVFEKSIRNPPKYRFNARTISRDGRRRLVLARGGDAIEVWDVDRELPLRLAGHQKRILHWALSPDGRWVYSDCQESRRLWDAQSGALLKVFARNEEQPNSYPPDSDGVFSPDGDRLVMRSVRKETELWDLKATRRIARLGEGPDQITVAQFSADGRRLITSGTERAALWDATNGTLLAEFEGGLSLGHFAISPTGNRLARKAKGNGIDLLSGNGQRIATLRDDSDRLRFSPDGLTLTTGDDSGSAPVRVWNAEDGAARFQVENSVMLAFSGDSRRLIIVTIAADESFRHKVLDARSGDEIAVLRGHKLPATQAFFSPDSRRVITTSFGGTVRLWNVDSGVELVKLGGEGERTREPNRFPPEQPPSRGGFFPDLSSLIPPIEHAGFSAGGRQVFTLEKTGRLRMFDVLKPEELILKAKAFSRRPLNAEERSTYFLAAEDGPG